MNADQIREIIRQELAAFFTGQKAAPPAQENEIESVQRRASELARAGFRAESIALMKSLSKRGSRRAA